MKWNDLIEMCAAGVAENISDTTNDFFQKYPLMLYIGAIQTTVSRMVSCLEQTYTFDTVASTELYNLPADIVKARAVRYEDEYYLGELPQKPWATPDTFTSQPSNFFLQGNYMGLYPIPSTSSEEIKIWYWKQTAPYALRLKDISTDATEVTVGVDENTMTFIVTGGASADTYTFDLTATANDTIAELITAINAEAGLKLVVKATINSRQNGADVSTNLQEFSATSIFGKDTCFFLEPQIPEEMQTAILYPAMMHKLKMQDREDRHAMQYQNEYLSALNEYYVRYKERYQGSANLIVGGNSVGGIGRPYSYGGYAIYP